MTSSTLYEFYNNLFDSVIADTDALRKECHRVRHEVYCNELGYEESVVAECERDDYDAHSVHGLLRHKESGQFVGTVRLILHRHDLAEDFLPIHKICAANGLTLPHYFPADQIAEISRFCIVKSFRRRLSDQAAAGSSLTAEELAADQARVIPSMSLGLISVMHRMARMHGVQQYCCEMEPFLIRLLTKLGIHFNHIGPLVEFHGLRQVCAIPVETWVSRMKEERPDVWDIVTNKGEYESLAPPAPPLVAVSG